MDGGNNNFWGDLIQAAIASSIVTTAGWGAAGGATSAIVVRVKPGAAPDRQRFSYRGRCRNAGPWAAGALGRPARRGHDCGRGNRGIGGAMELYIESPANEATSEDFVDA